MILVAPEHPGLWHDAALLNAEIGRLQRAMACLETVTRFDRDGGLQTQVAALMHRLRAKLN
jgi:Tetratricopeptide repeat